MNRRDILTITLSGLTAACTPDMLTSKSANSSQTEKFFKQKAAEIEGRIGGRLGITLVDSAGNHLQSHRGSERFAMCSTFKAALASALFEEHNAGRVDMHEKFTLSESDLVPYAPFVEAKLSTKEDTSLAGLAKASVQISDNAAANLVLKAIGGPAGFTKFVRSRGDMVTRLDRIEPYLNENARGDPRDTTSPIAMANLMHQLLIAETATNKGSVILQEWMEGSTTGAARIRAGLPKAWPVGNKTGTAPDGLAYNDIAIIWPSGNAEYRTDPVILTVYTDRPTVEAVDVDEAIADVARIVTKITGLPD